MSQLGSRLATLASRAAWRGALRDCAVSQPNNFNQLRLLAAFLVILGHAWPLVLGPDAVAPFHAALGVIIPGPFDIAVHGLAVNAFFIISGFLVTHSVISRKSLTTYFVSRGVRIYPALWVNLVVVCFIIGPMFTTLSLGEYFAADRLWVHFQNNVLLWSLIYDLPGVFVGHPAAGVNGSLWTLAIELKCYIVIGLLCGFGVMRRRFVYLALVVPFLIALFAFPDFAPIAGRVGNENTAFFFLGSLAYVARAWVPRSPALGVVCLVAAMGLPPGGWAQMFSQLGLTHLVLWAGLVAPTSPALPRWMGDPSYGVYIYAFPVQQMLVAIAPGWSPWAHAGVVSVAALVLGIASWRLIEAPALARKDAFAAALKSGAGRVRRRIVRVIPHVRRPKVFSIVPSSPRKPVPQSAEGEPS